MKDTDKKLKDTPNKRKPDEEGTIHISEFLKISDPESGEVFLRKRES